MKRFILSVIAVMIFSTGAIMAEEVNEGSKVVYKKKTVIDFSDVTIQGELVKPEGSYLVNRKRTKFSQLIKIRSDFNAELFNSTDMF
jgi:hypothetical protein